MSEKLAAIAAHPDSEKLAGLRQSSAAAVYGISTTRWFLAGGLLLFALLLWRTRLDHVGELLWQARWAFALIFIPYALVPVCETLGWRFAFPASRSLRFSELLRLTVAVKAVQFLTPSIIQAGEFMKVRLLLESGVKIDMATASVVVAKTTIMIAELLFIGLGLLLALGYVAVDPGVALSVTFGLVLMALCLIGGIFLQRAGLFRPLVWVSRHIRFLAAFIDRHEGVLSSTERIVQAHLDEKRRFVWSSVWFFMGWAAGIVEVWAFLNILGLPADVPSALFIQVWSLVVTRLTTFIPGNLGAQEAGTVMTFSFLGLSVESAMAFAVLRRLRQVGWIAASLGCLAKMSRH
jgi:uncharacterized protein (TIRG00374 family)